MSVHLLDINRLRQSLSDTMPSGVDIRQGGDVALYHRLKDSRSAARADERNIVPGQPFRLSSQWSDVRSIALEALEGSTSDLEILAWLCEAQLRLGGFAGLRDAFQLSAILVRERFDTLHSIDGDTLEDKVAPFTGLNGVSGEGTLIQPIRLTSLVPDAPFFESSLWDFQMAQRPGEEQRRKALRDSVDAVGSSAMHGHLSVVNACVAAFRDLTEAFEAACGADAPASSNIRSVLEDVRLAIVNLAGLESVVTAEAALLVADRQPAAAEAALASSPVSSGVIASREDAFARLLQIAEYFRRSEPQSPIARSIESIVERGRMDFVELLTELVQDEHARRNILIGAGIRTSSSSQS